jgi:hypothetical protein
LPGTAGSTFGQLGAGEAAGEPAADGATDGPAEPLAPEAGDADPAAPALGGGLGLQYTFSGGATIAPFASNRSDSVA